MGKTLHYIRTECNVKGSSLDDLSSKMVKERMGYSILEADDQWKVHLALEIMDVREGCKSVDGFSTNEVEDMLRCICIS